MKTTTKVNVSFDVKIVMDESIDAHISGLVLSMDENLSHLERHIKSVYKKSGREAARVAMIRHMVIATIDDELTDLNTKCDDGLGCVMSPIKVTHIK